MSDVNISYKGTSIATMDASGTKTLQTSGKYCEGDITVQYADPEKPTQTKSVTPSESAQTVTPDSGKVLSSVSVGAVSSTYVGSGVTRKAAATYTPGTTDQTIAAGQYLEGAQTVKGDANLVAANIKDGVSIFGVTGTHSGGDSSLPSIISKIDGGSFTLASDTAGNAHWISHNLGVLPKCIIIWTDDSDLRTSTATVSQRYLLCSQLTLMDWVTGTTSNALIPNHLFRNTNGATSNTGSPITQAAVGNYIQTTRFNNALGAAYYKAGVEYKWVAYA